jgi:hypothetical protein
MKKILILSTTFCCITLFAFTIKETNKAKTKFENVLANDKDFIAFITLEADLLNKVKQGNIISNFSNKDINKSNVLVFANALGFKTTEELIKYEALIAQAHKNIEVKFGKLFTKKNSDVENAIMNILATKAINFKPDCFTVYLYEVDGCSLFYYWYGSTYDDYDTAAALWAACEIAAFTEYGNCAGWF